MTFHPDGRTLFCGLDDSLKVNLLAFCIALIVLLKLAILMIFDHLWPEGLFMGTCNLSRLRWNGMVNFKWSLHTWWEACRWCLLPKLCWCLGCRYFGNYLDRWSLSQSCTWLQFRLTLDPYVSRSVFPIGFTLCFTFVLLPVSLLSPMELV